MITLLLGLLALVTAFVFEGISHGLRTANEGKFSLYWHSANVIFIALFSLSLYLAYKVLIINETPLDALLIATAYIVIGRWCVFNYSYNKARKKKLFY